MITKEIAKFLGVCCAKLFGLLVLFGVSVAFAGPKVVKEDKVVKENKVAKNGSNAGNGILVPGNPEALAWEAMPDHSTPATVDKSEISIDPETGAEVIRTTLYISFTAKATVAQVNSLLEEING
ncbi:MAG: hypothetical protein JNM39_07160 [Bdellovibrionaceae bacterium]|nr:hypothetical protein [Pseudobdellovibrionaceae bacterium]